MSTFRSLLNTSIARLENLSSSIHELQTRQSTPTETPRKPNMSDFSPPPPVSASWYTKKPAVRVHEPIREPDDLRTLHREEKAIEQKLQELLDAQAEGLVAGLTGEASNELQDDVLSTGSSTPTVSSPHSRRESHTSNNSVSQLRQARKINLRGARRGITKAIQRLAVIKAAEADLLNRHLEDNQTILGKIDSWDTKWTRLEERIQTIEQSDTGTRKQEIQQEADKLQDEITQLEATLRNMKARHRELLDEAAATDNAIQAKLSSYRSALAMLQADVDDFLKRPPITDVTPKEASFFSLTPKRRTLGMAREQWSEQQEMLEDEYSRTEVNRTALEDGAVLWEDVIHTVTRFEGALRQEMSKPPPDNYKGKQRADSSMNRDSIFVQMDNVIKRLEQGLEQAESKNWKLLVCCIGAELDAFKQGREMLRAALGVDETGADGDVESNATSGTQQSSRSMTSRSNSEDLEDTARAWRQDKVFDGSDEELDPHLLIAQRDLDPE